MADIELLLNAPELNTGIYEDFSTQEDALKVLHSLRIMFRVEKGVAEERRPP